MPSITITCYGVCKGDPKWRSKHGYCCSLCGGSGQVTTHDERETREREWEQVMSKARLVDVTPDEAAQPAPQQQKKRSVGWQRDLFGGR